MTKLIIFTGLIILALSSTFAANAVEEKKLSEIIRQIEDNPQPATTPDIIVGVIKRIEQQSAPSTIADDLSFLQCLINYDIDVKGGLTNSQKLMQVLNTKYMNNPDALMSLLLKEIDLYRNQVIDKEKLVPIVMRVEVLNKEIRNRQVVSQLTQLVELGEAYLALPGGDRPGELREKARLCFTQVLEYRMFLPVYEPSYAVLQQVYIRAAVGVVGITERQQLKGMRFAPFALDAIELAYPNQAKLISHEFPGMGAVANAAANYLIAAIQDSEEGSEIRKHMEAVLEFIRAEQKK